MGMAPQELYCDTSAMKLIKAGLLRLFLITLLILAAMIVGCGPHITDGCVIEKHYVPAHDMMEYNAAIEIMQFVHVPDRWTVEIGKYAEGQWVKRTVEVTKEKYDQCEVGEWADFAAD